MAVHPYSFSAIYKKVNSSIYIPQNKTQIYFILTAALGLIRSHS